MDENNDEIGHTEHELDIENTELIDPQLLQALQQHNGEEIFVEFDGSKGGGLSDKIGVIRDWLSRDNKPSTHLQTKDAVEGLVMLRNFKHMYPNHDLEMTQTMIDEILDDYEKYLLSIGGLGRQQEVDVLGAMVGDQRNMSPDEASNTLTQMLSNPPNNQDDE